MPEPLKLSPQTLRAIEELAATAFWRRVAARGYQSTFGTIDAAAAEELLISTFTADQVADYMRRRGIPGTPIQAIKIAIDILVKSQDEGRNLLGPILQDDIRLCRPSAISEEILEQVVSMPRKIIGGGTLHAHGTLVIRPPYPALVYANSKPPSGVFVIKDTLRALGRKVFMLMQATKTTPMPNGIQLTEGTLLIPAPDVDHGDRWERLIPNSTRSTGAMRVVTNDGLSEITFGW
ncbi:hypothetical protein ABIC83_003077 [Roseateles asaccharophilus]|uniref:hypothetical protein n=1 Tax=Roseateles asaccharophilus TaxID=582607 RepID=UPI00383642A7